MTDRFEKEEISIKDLILFDYFRTVENLKKAKTKTEIPVVIDLKKGTIKKLSFDVPWDGRMFAFLRRTDKLNEFLLKIGIEDPTIHFSDWDGKITFIIEDNKLEKEKSYYIQEQELIDLLEGCFRIPSQRNLDI